MQARRARAFSFYSVKEEAFLLQKGFSSPLEKYLFNPSNQSEEVMRHARGGNH